ncbi:MAG: ROK family protein [Verrucomicrobia bacterium]|nr:ROK family protein [Verrucomicrobiota bacterium]MDA1087035.1 ROK family protein [Verrucomicrobiota bacterium]
MLILGIDIGGTKTAVCMGNETGEILAAGRMSTNPRDGMDTYMSRVRKLVDEVSAECSIGLGDVDRIGISAPGPLLVEQGVLLAPPNNPGWEQVPIVRLFHESFHLPIFLNNDANANALAEYRFGAYKGANSLIYTTCSTGMGAGIVVNGSLIQGETDMGGEFGHHCVDPNGPPCDCGRRGCLELYVGGYALANRLKAMIREQHIETTVIEKAGGNIDAINLEALAAAAREGDAFAVEQWDLLTEYVAVGIGNLIMIINPRVVIMGTIAIQQGDFYVGPVREKLPRYTWSWNREACDVVASGLGDQIGNLGALAVAMQ